MDWILFFFIVSLLILAACIVTKRIFVRVIQIKLTPFFEETLKVVGGSKTFSLKKLKGSNQNCSFDIENLRIEFDIFGLINPQGTQLLSICADKLHFSINNFKLGKHEAKRTSLKAFIMQQALKNFFILIFNSFKFKVFDFYISINGFKVTSDKIFTTYRRQSNVIKTETSFEETIFAFNHPSVRIPNIQFTLSVSIDSLLILLKNRISDFSVSIPEVFVHYEDALFQTNPVKISIFCKKDKFSEGEVKIQPIDVYVPLFDLLTTSMALSVKNILISKDSVTTDIISFTRMNQNVLSIPSFLFKDHRFILGPVDIDISSPMFIDIGLLVRYFKSKLDLKPKQSELIDKYEKFRAIAIKSPEANLKVFFSDSHVIKFSFKKVAFTDMVASAKAVSGSILYGDKVVNFITGVKVSARIEPPRVDVKVMKADLVMSDEFPEATFVQEIVGIFKFLQSHIRGGSWQTRAHLPPTGIILSLVLDKGTVRYKRTKMAVALTRSVESKRHAMEELRIRQEKAIQIIQSQAKNIFNEELFEQESKKMFLQLYKKALSELPPPDNDLLNVEINDLECGMNGPMIKNREEAIERIKDICNEVKDEDLGRIGGATYSGTCEHVAWNIPYYGTVVEAEKLEASGSFFTVHHPGKVKSDFYMFKIHCDDGKQHFTIPMVSAKSVVFIDVKATAKSLSGKWGFAFIEWAHDFKLSSRMFRQRHYKVKWLQFIDHTRFRTRFKIDLKLQKFSFGLNDTLNAYGNPYYNFIAPNFNIKFDGHDYSFIGPRILICLETKLGFKTIATIYDPKITMVWETHNEKMPTDRKRPIFITIDSSRMTDPSYDPYEEWRTVTWSLAINFVTSNKSCIIDLDQLQDLLDRVTIPKSAIEKFFKPPLFVWRFSPWPRYGYVDLNVRCPPLLITMMQGAFTAKVTGIPINVKLNMSLQQSLSVSSNDVKVVCSYKMRKILSAQITDLSVVRNITTILVKINNIDANIALDDILDFEELPFKIHTPTAKKELSELQSVEDLYHHFSNILLTLSITNVNVKASREEETFMDAAINKLIFESRFDENRIMLNTFTFTKCNIMSDIDTPFVSINNPHICLVSATNKKIVLCTIHLIELFVTQEEIERLTASIKWVSSRNKVKPENSTKSSLDKPSYSITFSLEKITANLLHDDRTSFMNANINGISLTAKRNDDLSEVIKMTLKTIEALNPTAEDAFRNIVKCSNPAHPIFYLHFNQTKPLMRCPVFDRIDVKLNPFVISLDIKYIKSIMDFFKLPEDSQELEISEEELETMQVDELMENVNANTNNEDANLFFCRMFIFNPIDAGLNIRLPRDGVLSEFLNRPFHYRGMKYEDIFGTKQQIIALLKKNIKWAVIKALPKFFFKKNKE